MSSARSKSPHWLDGHSILDELYNKHKMLWYFDTLDPTSDGSPMYFTPKDIEQAKNIIFDKMGKFSIEGSPYQMKIPNIKEGHVLWIQFTNRNDFFNAYFLSWKSSDIGYMNDYLSKYFSGPVSSDSDAD